MANGQKEKKWLLVKVNADDFEGLTTEYNVSLIFCLFFINYSKKG